MEIKIIFSFGDLFSSRMSKNSFGLMGFNFCCFGSCRFSKKLFNSIKDYIYKNKTFRVSRSFVVCRFIWRECMRTYTVQKGGRMSRSEIVWLNSRENMARKDIKHTY